MSTTPSPDRLSNTDHAVGMYMRNAITSALNGPDVGHHLYDPHAVGRAVYDHLIGGALERMNEAEDVNEFLGGYDSANRHLDALIAWAQGIRTNLAGAAASHPAWVIDHVTAPTRAEQLTWREATRRFPLGRRVTYATASDMAGTVVSYSPEGGGRVLVDWDDGGVDRDGGRVVAERPADLVPMAVDEDDDA